jgi:hypothetical protein
VGRVLVNDGIAYVTLGDMILVLWKDAARVHRLRWLFDQVDAAVAKHPGGIVGLQLVLPSASPHDGPARNENSVRMRKLGGGLRRLVTVPLGDAFWVTIVRAVMRTLALLSGQSKVQFVANSEDQGLDLALQAASADTPSRQEVIAALDEMYAALGVARTKAAA